MSAVWIDPVEFDSHELAELVALWGIPTSAGEARSVARLVKNRGRLALDPGDGGEPLRADPGRAPDRGSPLLRAIGVRRGVRSVVDATAGLGRDGFCLVAAGCEVTLVEREPWLAALLHDTAVRLGRATVVLADAVTFLRSAIRDNRPRPDAVYLDPMFTTLPKAALPKRELQVLRALCDDSIDAPMLLDAARAVATRRVVVKRRSSAPPLDGERRIATVEGKAVRYDVYGPKASATNPERS